MIKIIRLLFLSLMVYSSVCFSQTSGIRVRNLNQRQGLSQAHANTAFVDSRGYLWVGTNDGLNRYDGHENLVYRYDLNNTNSISDNYVKTIIEDPFQRLWVGTDAGGLCVIDLKTEKIQRIAIRSTDAAVFTQPQIWDLIIDDEENIWIATWGGLYKIDLRDDKLEPIKQDQHISQIRCLAMDPFNTLWIGTETQGVFAKTRRTTRQILPNDPLLNHRIYSILNHPDGSCWFGTDAGLIRYDPAIESASSVLSLNSNRAIDITTLALDASYRIWAGSIDHGLLIISPHSAAVHQLAPTPQDIHGLHDSGILKIHIDKNQLLWIATRGGGVQYFDIQAPFDFSGYIEGHVDYLRNPSVRAILTDGPDIWVGGYGGLTRYEIHRGVKQHFDTNNKGLANQNVYSLLKDPAGTLWIGTEGGGLFYLQAGMDNPKKYQTDTMEPGAVANIFELYQANNGTIYLGTGTGLYQITPEHKFLKPPQHIALDAHNQHALDAEDIYAICEAESGILYIGTGSSGVYGLDEKHHIVVHHAHNPNDQESLSSNRIKVIHQDQDGGLWIGTNGGGLNKLDPDSATFTHFGESDGLPDNTIYGILEDIRGRLWLSTNNGIALYDETARDIRAFGLQHGLQGLEFNTGAYHQSAHGEMFFGGIQGLNSFFPEEITVAPPRLPVSITNFRISNQKVFTGSPLLPVDINEIPRLVLSHKERLITFEFSNKDFISSENTNYRYMISGIDDDWVQTAPGQNSATYTDLPSGKYEFLVQASQPSFNYFSETHRLNIVKKPAPWKSWWAQLTLGLIVVSALYLIRKNELKKLGLKTELQQKHQEAQKLNEIDDMKSRLISNVSHELKNPLTLLAGHLNAIDTSEMKSIDADIHNRLAQARESLGMVNELSSNLLELAAFTSGRIKLQTQKEDLATTIESMVDDFRGHSAPLGTQIEFFNAAPALDVYIDKSKIEQVMINLLSNAVKFSTPESTITVILTDDPVGDDDGTGSFPCVAVINTGVGITPLELKNIFERPYENDLADSTKKTGAGFGLALVKELVELHGGSISVKSELDGKTVFEFSIPTGTNHLLPHEIVEREPKPRPKSKTVTPEHHDPRLVKILVIEDENSMLTFLEEGLEDEFSVLTAMDGVEGLQLAKQKLPDIIIVDLFLPNKGGLELVQEIRKDLQLAQTPIVMITGQEDPQHRLNAFKAGTNDFINKPFSLEELKIRLSNVLNQRMSLIKSVQEDATVTQYSEAPLSVTDSTFYDKITGLIEENLAQSDFTVDSMAKALFMSRRQLERKLKDVCGQTPSDLIRQTRLSRANSFLREGAFATVSEVAHAVGFKNVKYFSRLFKNQFKHSPTNILRQ